MRLRNNRIYPPLLAIALAIFVLAIVHHETQTRIKKATTGELGKINILLNGQVQVPISYWGSSTSLVHVSPHIIDSITGSSSFNFSLDGTFFQQYSGFLKSYAENAEPGLIVIGINITDFHPRDQIYHPHNYTEAIKNHHVQSALATIDPLLSWKMRWIPLYSLVLYDAADYINLIDQNNNQTLMEQKGFEPQFRNGFAEVEKFAYDSIEIHEPFVRNLKTVAAELKQRGNHVVFFVAPIYSSAFDDIQNLGDFNDVLNDLRMGGYTVLDYLASPISKRKDLFYNHMHLNANGARLFSIDFAHDLNEVISTH